MVCKGVRKCRITSVETGDFAGHGRERLLLLEEVIKIEYVALRAFAVHAHALLFHAECRDQNYHKYHERNGQYQLIHNNNLM